MKGSNWKITAMLVTMLAGAGIGFLNIEDELPQHPIKEYRFRSLDRDLNITYHHTVTEKQTLEQIANGHIERGFPGIAYHFAIFDNGDVFQLQSLEEITYHSKGHNTESIGIVFVGNFQERTLTKLSIESAECLQGGLEASLNIIGVRGHRDVRATLCPGDYAYQQLEYLFY